ncbi:hypothetical protein ACU4GR_27560 [Methylobacterium oryzae CBMB20]
MIVRFEHDHDDRFRPITVEDRCAGGFPVLCQDRGADRGWRQFASRAGVERRPDIESCDLHVGRQSLHDAIRGHGPSLMDPRVEISGISNGVAKDGDRSLGALSTWTQDPGNLLQRRCLRNEEAFQIEGSGSHG